MDSDLEMATTAVKALIDDAGGPDQLITPRGWPHLGLAIIDAVYSLQADYDTVVTPLLKRYCDAAPGLQWTTASSPRGPEHDAQRLIEFLEPMELEDRCNILNRQIGPGTAKRGLPGVPKAEIVVQVAHVLMQHGVISRADFTEAVFTDPQLEWAVRRVDGVATACWKYMLSLSGIEVSKPDTMVLRWLAEVTGRTPSTTAGASLLENATKQLQEEALPVTVRQVDHLVWRKASGRALNRSE